MEIISQLKVESQYELEPTATIDCFVCCPVAEGSTTFRAGRPDSKMVSSPFPVSLYILIFGVFRFTFCEYSSLLYSHYL